MRYGEVSTPSIQKPGITNTPAIGNAHNNATGDAGSTLNTADDTVSSNITINPWNAPSCYTNNSKCVKAQASGYYNRKNDLEYGLSGDLYNLGGNTTLSLSNPNSLFKLDLEITIKKMANNKLQNDSNLARRKEFGKLYPSSEGWEISNGGKLGMLAHNPKTGEYGVMQEDGSLALFG